MITDGLIYSELLDLLQKRPAEARGGMFGTLISLTPLTLQVRGKAISQGLFYPRGTVFHQEDLGSTFALLPCEEGFLILFQTEEEAT